MKIYKTAAGLVGGDARATRGGVKIKNPRTFLPADPVTDGFVVDTVSLPFDVINTKMNFILFVPDSDILAGYLNPPAATKDSYMASLMPVPETPAA